MRLRGQNIGILLVLILMGSAFPAQVVLGGKSENHAPGMSEQRRALHAVNRLGFGPRPGDVEQVAAMGVDKWIDLQLHPEKIDNAALDSRLASFRTLRMDSREIVENYPPRKLIKAVQEGKPPMPSDPAKRAVYKEQIEKLQASDDGKKGLGRPQREVVMELAESKLLRATYSQRQLQEVMTDFWFNHFNVFIGKGADRYLVTSYERDVIRPHALGKFEDLLVATAKSPAMLFYLDNWLSVGPNSTAAKGGKGRRPGKGKRNGLNENYGRELMELHTLGVDGGYTQKDVTEVARVFTGWTVKRPRLGGDFTFDERMHDPGDKTVLGHRIKDRGEKEGLDVLHMIARHPSTAHFVCNKLAVRFVSDNPPPALVDRMAHTFRKKDGDIREVPKTLFRSPEFWDQSVYRAKVKTPLEFVVSALRASDADVSDAALVARQLQKMGMPLYGMQPPTGYSMKADSWVNSSALLDRMNFALALARGSLKGVQVDSGRMVGTRAGPDNVLATLEQNLLAGDVSSQTHQTIASQMQNTKSDSNLATIAGLILGSPEFQRR